MLKWHSRERLKCDIIWKTCHPLQRPKIECMFLKLERAELLTERELHMAVFWQKQIIFQNILLIHGHWNKINVVIEGHKDFFFLTVTVVSHFPFQSELPCLALVVTSPKGKTANKERKYKRTLGWVQTNEVKLFSFANWHGVRDKIHKIASLPFSPS